MPELVCVCPYCGSDNLACHDITLVTIPIIGWIQADDGTWVPDEFADWEVSYDTIPENDTRPYGCQDCDGTFATPAVKEEPNNE